MVKDYQSLGKILREKGIIDIPITDEQAWIKYPNYHHIYNKLWIAESQDLPCGPMGIYPQENTYPVIFKPLINLYGMSRGVVKINNDDEYDENIKDGLFWEEFLEGEHRCVDLIIRNGSINFVSCWLSFPDEKGSFNYHVSDPNYKLPSHLKEWVETFFDDYTGCLNFETINNTIIECHLRLNGDAQLYGEEFVDELWKFFKGKQQTLKYQIEKKYLIPIFVKKGFKKELDKDKIIDLCENFGVISLFFDNVNSKRQSEYMSRILIFDIDNLEKGFDLRNYIKKHFL